MAGETLKVTAGNASGSAIPLEQELVIGRSTPGLGSLGGDSEISRVHARVHHDASGQLTVEDLGSTNGTFVNGNRISSPTPLRPGDELRVGQTTLTVEGGADEGATAVGQPIPPAIAVPPPAAAATPPTEPLPPTQPLPPAQPPPPAQPRPGAQYGQQPGYAGGPPGRQGGGSKAPWIALAAVVLIALIVAGLAIGGVFSSDKKNTASTTTTPVSTAATPATPPPTSAMPTPSQTPSAPSGGGYPPGFVDKLIQGCAKGGKLTPSQCQCWFTKLKNAYTFTELITVIKKARNGSIPPKAVSLLRTCLNQ
jgi:predicted component of type VI protein secretion system